MSIILKCTVVGVATLLPVLAQSSESQFPVDVSKKTPSMAPPVDVKQHDHFYGMRVPKEHINYLESLLDWLEDNGKTEEQQAALGQFWAELKVREQDVYNIIAGHPEEDPEDGSLLLYFLNNYDPALAARMKQTACMPPSQISTEEFETLLPAGTIETLDVPIEGWLDSGGNLYNATKYSQLDPGWSTALAYYMGYKVGHIHLAPLGKPTVIDLSEEDDVDVLVVGDWGTGYWDDSGNPSPAQQIMFSMQQHPALITLHLGDEYYAGTQTTLTGKPGEEAFNFTNLWDPGTSYSFALGSNHGMYDAENGLRYITLNSPKFAPQKQTTTFAIVLKEWVIVALDTARYDTSDLFLKGAINEAQGEFLKEMGQLGKKLLLVTHHNGLSLDGKEQNNPLWSQINSALGRDPDYWIWAHVHQGVAYSKSSAAGNTVGRLLGHGGIPVGRASVLYQKDGSWVPEVEFYSDTPYENPDREQKLRISNGYGLLNFSGLTVTEQLFDQYGNLQWRNELDFDN